MVGCEKSLFCGWLALKRTGCLQQMFKMMPLRLHVCMQSCLPLIKCLVTSMMLCGMLPVHVSMTRCFKCMADVANRVVLYACTFLRFVQPLLGNSHINYRALYPFNWYKLLIKTLSLALITIFTQRSRDAVTVMWKTRQYHFHHFT